MRRKRQERYPTYQLVYPKVEIMASLWRMSVQNFSLELRLVFGRTLTSSLWFTNFSWILPTSQVGSYNGNLEKVFSVVAVGHLIVTGLLCYDICFQMVACTAGSFPYALKHWVRAWKSPSLGNQIHIGGTCCITYMFPVTFNLSGRWFGIYGLEAWERYR